MQPRQLVIVAVAVLVAFGAAFGIAKGAGGDESGASGSFKPAEVIEVGDVTVAGGAVDTGGLPALRVPEETPEPAGDDPSATPGPEATVAPTGTVTPSSTAPPTSTQPPQDDGGELSGGEE